MLGPMAQMIATERGKRGINRSEYPVRKQGHGQASRRMAHIYSTNIGTEYFKYGVYSPCFISSKCSLFHNSNVFGSCIIHILFTGVLKLKKNKSCAKRLNMVYTLRFFSSKCSLFHNSNVFVSCVIHILYKECAKIKKK